MPDGGWCRGEPTGDFIPTARMVLEVLSANDGAYDKFAFYATHDVGEVLVADPDTRTVNCHVRRGATYVMNPGSDLLSLPVDVLETHVRWA